MEKIKSKNITLKCFLKFIGSGKKLNTREMFINIKVLYTFET